MEAEPPDAAVRHPSYRHAGRHSPLGEKAIFPRIPPENLPKVSTPPRLDSPPTSPGIWLPPLLPRGMARTTAIPSERVADSWGEGSAEPT
jgi:hypothetical protein